MNYSNKMNPENNISHNIESREISVEEILQTILRRKIGIIVIVMLSLLGATMVYFGKTPEYRAVAVMMSNDNSSSNNLIDKVLTGGATADMRAAQKDFDLIQSLPISEMTVRALWKSSKRDSLEIFGQHEYISPLRRILGLIVPVKQNKRDLHSVVENSPLFEEMMRSYAMQLNMRIQVKSSQSGVLNVSVKSPFPEESVLLTNKLCEVYKKTDIQRNSEKYIQSNRFVADMLNDQQQLLSNADAALSKFMNENKIYEVSGNTEALLGKLVEYETRYNDIMAEYNITQNNKEFLEKKLTENEKNLSNRIARNVNVQLASLQEQMRSKETEYIKILREKDVNDPDVKTRKQELDQLKSRYDQLSRSKISGQIGYMGQGNKSSYDVISEKLQLEQKLNTLSFSAEEYKKLKQYFEKQLGYLPDKEQTFVRLQRDRDVISKTYLYLREKLDETRILIGSEVGSVSMIGSAFKPFFPEAPDFYRDIIAGGIIGFVFAGIYVFSAEMLDDRVIDEKTFFKALGFNIWGVIPYLKIFERGSDAGYFGGVAQKISTSTNLNKDKDKEKNTPVLKEKKKSSYPIMSDNLNSIFAESIRTLRTNLGFHMVDGPMKSILISGCSIGEGKSTICSNLAISWAISDKKTLIIDADLRRPDQHNIFERKRTPGLADCLVSSQEHDDIQRYIQDTKINNLFLMSSGSNVPNPNELLGSQKMKNLVKELNGMFDKIIIDSPPIYISDAAQLVDVVDGVLLGARLNYSSKSVLRQYAADSYLHKRIIGVALIDKPRPTQEMFGGGKYGYGKYGYNKYYAEK